jgi:uncharacterized protein YmfQ (DUF2313 family)
MSTLELLIAHWRQLVNQHLPRGEAISRNPASNWQKWAVAVATVFARLQQDIEAIAKEWIPLFTLTRLDDWVTTTTSKNDCGAVTNTVDERRGRVLAKLRMVAGGMDGANGSAAAIAYLEAVASRLGYEVTIVKTATCVLTVTINSYNGGVACHPRRYGDRYNTSSGLYGDCGYALLACILDKVTPARYQLIFSWPT